MALQENNWKESLSIDSISSILADYITARKKRVEEMGRLINKDEEIQMTTWQIHSQHDKEILSIVCKNIAKRLKNQPNNESFFKENDVSSIINPAVNDTEDNTSKNGKKPTGQHRIHTTVNSILNIINISKPIEEADNHLWKIILATVEVARLRKCATNEVFNAERGFEDVIRQAYTKEEYSAELKDLIKKNSDPNKIKNELLIPMAKSLSNGDKTAFNSFLNKFENEQMPELRKKFREAKPLLKKWAADEIKSIYG